MAAVNEGCAAGPSTLLLTDLDEDVLLEVLSRLESGDLLRLGCTCRRLRTVSRNECLWERQCLKRWERWTCEASRRHFPSVRSWKELFHARIDTDGEGLRLVEQLAHPSTRDAAARTLAELGVSYFELLRDASGVLGGGAMDLTARYYARELFDALHIDRLARNLSYLRNVWTNEGEHAPDRVVMAASQPRTAFASDRLEVLHAEDWEAGPASCALEDAVALISQWEKPVDIRACIKEPMEMLAALTRQKMQQARVGNPCVSLPAAVSVPGCRVAVDIRALEALCSALFDEYKLRGNTGFYYNPLNSCLHYVLKMRTGIPITLSVVFACVARRVGIPVYMVSAPQHFLCKTLVYDPTTGGTSTVLIDPFRSGHRMTRLECMQEFHGRGVQLDSKMMSAATTENVLLRMLRNLWMVFRESGAMLSMGTILRLVAAVDASHIADSWAEAVRCFCRAKRELIGVAEAQSALRWIQGDECESTACDAKALSTDCRAAARDSFSELHEYACHLFTQRVAQQCQVVPHASVRGPEILYGVGCVLRHRVHHYHGVVVGWDNTCRASEEWIQRMNVDSLRFGRNQPFYRVLVDARDRPFDQVTYVAQENITSEITRFDQVRHSEIGRYFSHFEERHGENAGSWWGEDRTVAYIPNRELTLQYPLDREGAERRRNKPAAEATAEEVVDDADELMDMLF